VEALLDALVQRARSDGSSETCSASKGSRRLAAPLQLRQRRAGDLMHLERALDALRVGGLDARGGSGIDRGELGVQSASLAAARASMRARTAACALAAGRRGRA
jgi:hypothetical protein